MYKDIISRCWSIVLPYVRFLLLVFLSLTLSLSWSNLFWDGVMAASVPSVAEQQGREWYQQGQVNQAIATWLKTAQDYEQQGDIISQGRVLSYLALAYSQLGNWEAADISINQSLQLLQSQTEDSETIPVLAEALNIQGTLFLAKGNPLAALSSWETATETYQKVGETSGILRSKINQARALQALGLYKQACKQLVADLTSNSLECEDLTIDKVTPLLSNDFTPLQQAGWLTLAQILGQQGNLDSSEEILNQILSQVSSTGNKASILFNLGQNLELQADLENAKETYQQAISIATNIETKLKAQLAQLNLLITQKSWQEVENLWINIDNNLSQFPLNKTKIDGQIYLANLLLQWSNLADSDKILPSWQKIKILLEKARENSQSINYEQGIIYAFGDLGNLYEKLALNKTCQGSFSESIDCSNNYQFSDINQLTLSSQQLQEKAQKLTEQALIKSQAFQIPNTTYNLQWQLGRILNSLGQKTEAISAYLEAIRNLNSLTVDLVNDREFQLSFQEKVRPIYIELLSLLLPQNNQELVSQENLEEARKQIEALQVAELNNFFQDICVESQPVDVAKIDPNAAIIYPLILRDRLVTLV
ncbi:MAG: tetratricopeptide repeat protein, partial [Crocosphaera sp.]